MRTLTSTPSRDGFRMPGEFEEHACSWMLWPFRPDIWPFGAKPAQRAFVAVANAVARFEPITVGVCRDQFLNARSMLPLNVRVIEMSYNGAWIRDHGPTFVVDNAGSVRGVDWGFNAWGGLDGGAYFPWDQDSLVARKVLEIENIDRYKVDMVLEGGSIHVDGEGTLLATEECLLNPNRNPQLTKTDIEEKLREYLDIDKTVWLGKGIHLDEAGGHIDNLCCFIRPGVVALNWTDDHTDPQYEISRDAYERLSVATDARGRRFEVHKIHQPGPFYLTKEESEGTDRVEGTAPRREGDRLPASYINFYVANGGIIMPTFDDLHDARAQEKLQDLFSSYEVVGVPARDILPGGGNIHCILQQQPRGSTKKGRE